MRENLKRIFSLLLLTVFIFTGSQGLATNIPYHIYDDVESEVLAPGVKYENIKRFTSAGWMNINLVRVDIKNDNNEIKGLFSDKGVSHRESVNKLVDQSPDVVAGINGDFFDYGPISHPIGGFIQDGEIISSPVHQDYAWPSFLIDSSDKAQALVMSRTMTAKNLTKNRATTVTSVNKAKSAKNMPNASIVYTHRWGSKTPGNTLTRNVREIVVDKGVVTEIRNNKGPVPLKKDRYIIHLRGSYIKVSDHFKKGDKVKLNLDTKPDLENIKFMIGGNSQILKDGKPTATHSNIKGNHPRTGIGISEDGNELVLATVDGRHSKYKGVSQELFGAILKDLGMHNAINLDGGGSTTMAIKRPNHKNSQIVNIPSDKYPRKVSNGVGVQVSKVKGKLSGVKIDLADTNVFRDTERILSAKGYDSFFEPVKIDPEKLEFELKGIDAEFTEEGFIPKEAGVGTLHVKYDNFRDSVKIRVLEKPISIDLPFERFSMVNKDKLELSPIYGHDGNGFKALIHARDIDFNVSNELGEFKGDYFHSNDTKGSGVITANIGDAVNNILIAVGSNDIPVKNFGNLKDLSFTSPSEEVSGSISLSPESKSGKESIKLSYDFNKAKENRIAVMNFKDKTGINLRNNVNKIGVWVKADENNLELAATIKDIFNKEHKIVFKDKLDFKDWQYIEAKIPYGVTPKSFNNIYLSHNGAESKNTGEVLLDGLTFGYGMRIKNYDNLPEATENKDIKYQEVEAKEEDISFSITKIQDNLNNITNQKSIEVLKNNISNKNVGVFMGGVKPELISDINTNLIINSGSPFFLSEEYGNALFLNINTLKGGITPQNENQWLYIKRSLDKTESDHIIAILPTKVFGNGGFKNKKEAQMFHDIMSEQIDKGKSVWVIQGSTRTGSEIKDGIRYIEFDQRNIKSNEELKNIQTIDFVIKGKDIFYQINNPFK